MVERITIALQNAANKQKKTVNHNIGKIKPWWDNDILKPIVKKRNQARKWMLLSKSPTSFECYKQWQSAFREKILELKRNHWHKFLAKCDDNAVFKA
jgi:hypothetical protein